MTTRIMKATKFSAAHSLSGHEGPCARKHGHTYRVEVVLKRVMGGVEGRPDRSDTGMVMDFGDVDRLIRVQVTDRFDHQDLDQVVSYRPTAENLANDIMCLLNETLAGTPIRVCSVRLWESMDSWAEVSHE